MWLTRHGACNLLIFDKTTYIPRTVSQEELEVALAEAEAGK